jgi:hypothetical protein
MDLTDDESVCLLSICTELSWQPIITFKFKTAALDAAEILEDLIHSDDFVRAGYSPESVTNLINEKLFELDFPVLTEPLSFANAWCNVTVLVTPLPLRD